MLNEVEPKVKSRLVGVKSRLQSGKNLLKFIFTLILVSVFIAGHSQTAEEYFNRGLAFRLIFHPQFLPTIV